MPENSLAERLISLIDKMRPGSKKSLEQFLDCAEASTGGIVVLQAPCTYRKRDLPEAGFRSELFSDLK
jgi:hypothetical protein